MTEALSGNKETLGQRAYRQIRDSIINGDLDPGQRLPIRRLAKSLAMGMAPVGEALRELGRDGLIELERGWGARVRRLDSEAVRNQHVLRTALECEAARHCAVLADDHQLDALLDLARQLDKRIDSEAPPKEVRELDFKLHLRIAQLSGTTSLVEALRANQLVRLLARGSLMARGVKRPKRQHIKLVEAIRTRDPDTAEQAMREHCLRSMALQLPRAGAVEA